MLFLILNVLRFWSFSISQPCELAVVFILTLLLVPLVVLFKVRSRFVAELVELVIAPLLIVPDIVALPSSFITKRF